MVGVQQYGFMPRMILPDGMFALRVLIEKYLKVCLCGSRERI